METINSIFEKLKNNEITHDDAKTKVLSLFGVINRQQKWLYIFGLCSGWLLAAILFVFFW